MSKKLAKIEKLEEDEEIIIEGKNRKIETKLNEINVLDDPSSFDVIEIRNHFNYNGDKYYFNEIHELYIWENDRWEWIEDGVKIYKLE